MKVVLPYPPSANAYWRTWKGRMLKSSEARAYQKNVLKLALAAGAMAPLSGPVVLEILVCRPRAIGDLDNSLKVTLDALKGILYVDDAQVVEIHARRVDDKADPRIEVRAHGEWLTGELAAQPPTREPS